MIDFNQDVFESPPFIRVHLNGNWCNINEAEYPEAWAELQDHLAKGGKILLEPLPPEPSAEEVAIEIRQQRNNLLLKTDYTQLNDSPKDKIKYAEYRQLLRDIPNQKGFPNKIIWPKEPN